MSSFQTNWVFNNMIEDIKIEQKRIETFKRDGKKYKEYGESNETQDEWITRMKEMRDAAK